MQFHYSRVEDEAGGISSEIEAEKEEELTSYEETKEKSNSKETPTGSSSILDKI